jgi:hypothetical protein
MTSAQNQLCKKATIHVACDYWINQSMEDKEKSSRAIFKK